MGLMNGIMNRIIKVIAHTEYEPVKVKKRKFKVTTMELVIDFACNALQWMLKKLHL